MTQLAIIRHGHTHWNRAGRIQGRTDIPLDENAQSELAAQKLPLGWQDADIVASPLARAADTARLISDREPAEVPALIEMNWGDWEGLHGVDLKADPQSGFRDIEHWGWDYHPPNGESPLQVWQRLETWISALERDTVAVCHIGIMRVILARAYGWEFEGTPPFKIKRNRLYVVDISPHGLSVQGDPIRLEAR